MEFIYDRTAQDTPRVKSIKNKVESGGWDTLSEDEKGYYLRGAIIPLNCLDGELWASDGPLLVRDGIVRGAYNISDFNRVENNVREIGVYLKALQQILWDYMGPLYVAPDEAFDVPYDQYRLPLDTKTDWERGDSLTPAEAARYLDNALWTIGAVPYEGTPALPETMNSFNWEYANNLERGLELGYGAALQFEVNTKDRASRTAAGYVFCGEVYGGEVYGG